MPDLNEKMQLVTVDRLGYYDTKIKGYIGDEIDGAIDALDTAQDVTVASQSGKAVTIAGSLQEVDGVISAGSASNITLADVASTGAAEDITYDNTTSGLTATDAQAAIDELAEASAGGVASKTIYITDDTSTSGTDYASIIKFYQGSNGSAANPDPNELVKTINIVKDQFLDSAETVNITYSDGHLYDGITDVTDLIKGQGVPATEADAGKYVKFVFSVTSGTYAKNTIYLSVIDLSHVYTGGSTAEITIAIDPATDIVTGTINDISASKITYIAASVEQGTSRESVLQALTRLDGADTVVGSVAKKIKDAIEALDTVSDVGIASVSNNVVTLKGSVKQVDGLIAQGTASDVVLEEVAYTGAAADVSYSATIAGTTVSNADDALDELVDLMGDGYEECTTAAIDALFD